MRRRSLLHATLLATVATLAPIVQAASAPVAGHDPAWSPNQPMGNQLNGRTRAYYFELFAHVARWAPIEEWSRLALAVQRLDHNQLSLAEAEQLYEAVASRLPVVRVTWDGQDVRLSSAPEIELTRGLPRHVLVEVVNRDFALHELQAEFAGGLPSNEAVAPRGKPRGLLTELRVDDAGANSALLTLRSGALADVVRVPIRVVEPAILYGRALETDIGERFPARIQVLDAHGEYRHGEAFRDNSTLSVKRILGVTGKDYRLPFFYTDGTFEVHLPPGLTQVTLERGFEYERSSRRVLLQPGERQLVTLGSGRFIDMRSRSWISGDTHVHWVKNWWYENEQFELLPMVQRAEDVQVVNNLSLRHAKKSLEWVKPDQFPMGPVPGHTRGRFVIQMGEEYRNDPFYGHLNFLNLTRRPVAPPVSPLELPVELGLIGPTGLVQPISTGDLLGPFAEDWPVNYIAIDAALTQEPPESRPIVIAAHGLGGEVEADVVLGRIDSLDQITPAEYYNLLDCGLRLPLTDGTDHPARPVGQTRCYVKIDRPFTYGAWIDGILSKSTFVTSGPMLFLSVEGVDVGQELSVSSGTPVTVRVEAHSRDPIGRLQVVSNGQVLFDQHYGGRQAVASFVHDAVESRWIVARCSAVALPTFHPLREPLAAQTSALYLVVDGQAIFVDSGAAQTLRDRCQAGGDNVFANGLFFSGDAAQHRRDARDYFYAARDAYQAIIDANP